MYMVDATENLSLKKLFKNFEFLCKLKMWCTVLSL
jgi:hypothetical protein